MPLCPQITNTPVTVTNSGSFTVTNVVPVLAANTEQLAATDASVAAANAAAAAASTAAAAAAVTAGAAQTTANTALANAATAYTAATGSLQPSASTIVNASNQMTAIAANGITVYSGSSASSGARVVLNSTGLAGFNSGGTATFSISASTGAAVFSGSVTGATITGSDLNIAGVFLVNGTTGVMTATSATITGVINATSGYFGTVANGFSISSTGLVGVGAGTIVGGAISGTTFTNGSTFSVTSAGVLTATSGTIGGFTLSSTGLTAGSSLSIQTTGTITGGNSQTIFYGYANIGGGSATGARLIVAGTSELNGNVAVLGNITATNSVTFGASTQQFEFLSSSGNVRVAQSYSNSVSGRAMQISSAGLYGTTASTRRKKHEIASYKIDSSALLNLDVKTFKYKPEIDADQSVQYGFIAEEAQELGLDELIQYDSTGIPDYFAYEKLPIFLLQLVQELKAEIDQLKGA